VLAAALGFGACKAIVGDEAIDFEPPGDGGVQDGQASEGSTSDASGDACASADDPHNCGFCGHDCLGATCAGGLCAPATFAGMQESIDDLALDPMHAYWTIGASDGGVLLRQPLDGGTAETVMTSPSRPALVDLDGTNLYFTLLDSPTMRRCTKGSPCDPSDPASDVAQSPANAIVQGIANDDANVYYTDGSGLVMKAIKRSTASFSQVTLRTGAAGPLGIASNGTHVFWTNNAAGTVEGCFANGCTTPTVLTKGQTGATAIAADPQNVYWSTADAIVRCPATPAGCTPEVLATGQSSPLDIAVDPKGVYWTDTPAGSVRVQTCPLAGCGASPRMLALVPGGAPARLALSDKWVYWTIGGPGGAIYRVAR